MRKPKRARWREALIEQWIFLPERVVKDMWTWRQLRQMGRDDALQHGYVALIKAADAFAPVRGVQFKTFAYCCISNYLCRCVSNEWLVRPPKSQRSPDVVKSCQVLPSLTVVDDREPGAEMDAAELAEIVQAAIGTLPLAEAAVVNMRYFGEFDGAAMADSMGCTRKHISAISKRAVDMLRDAIVAIE